jgi:hypothetical protein
LTASAADASADGLANPAKNTLVTISANVTMLTVALFNLK